MTADYCNYKISRVPLKPGISLFTSPVTYQRGCPKGSTPW